MDKKIYILAALLALTAGIAAGCGDEDNPQANSEITIPIITTEQVITTDEITEPEIITTETAVTTTKKPVATNKPVTTKKPVVTTKAPVTTKKPVTTTAPKVTTTIVTTTIDLKPVRDNTAKVIAETVGEWLRSNIIYYTLDGKYDELPSEYRGKNTDFPYLETNYSISGPEFHSGLRGYWYVKMRDDDHVLVDYVIWSPVKFTDTDPQNAARDKNMGYYKVEYEW